MIRVITALVLATLLLAACGDAIPFDTGAPAVDSSATTPSTAPEETLGGFGSPSQAPGEFGLSLAGRPVSGVLRLDDLGCWYVEFESSANLVVFPSGFEIPFAVDPTVITDRPGTTFASGMAIDGTVHEVPAEMLPGGEDGRWGNYLAFCQPAERLVAVFGTMLIALDPTALTDTEIEELVLSAEFTFSWACGRGWAISTPDERVGLFVYQQSTEQLKAQTTVDLPNHDWVAEIIVGKHLFVDHCDDVAEPWEPSPVVGKRWPLTAGSLVILDDFPVDPEPGSVRATLTGGLLETPDGRRIELPPIELSNRSFNFFAG
jgi:hypothetical protein